jgi:cytochrome c5
VYNEASWFLRINTKEAHVSVDTQKEKYSGVRCYSCGEAIPLPTKTVQKVNARAAKVEAAPAETPIIVNLRCKACEKESFYGVPDIVQIEGTPRLSRAGARANAKLMRPLSHGLAHAANG